MKLYELYRRIANLLTLGRLFAIPAVILLLFYSRQFPEYQRIALIVLICMQASDILDGYLARLYMKKSGSINRFGQIMDPVADKLYINLTYITLSITHNLPLWIAATILARDIFLILGWGMRVLFKSDMTIKPNILGKACDSIQAIYIISFLLNIPSAILDFGAILTIILTIISGLVYAWRDYVTYLSAKFLTND